MDMAVAGLPDAPAKEVFSDTVQYCSKCCRKLGDEGKALRRSLKAAVRAAHGEAVEVEKADCFSLCPKGGQVAAARSKKRGRRVVILEPGSDVELAAEYLLKAG